MLRAICLGIELGFILLSADKLLHGADSWLEPSPQKVQIKLRSGITEESFREAEPLIWVMLSNPDCRLCQPNYDLISGSGSLLTDKLVVPFDRHLPVWQLRQGDEVIVEHLGTATVDLLRQKMPAKARVTKLVVADISKADITSVLELLGRKGSYEREDVKPFKKDFEDFSIETASKFKATWNTVGSEIACKFEPKLTVKLSMLPVSISLYQLSYSPATKKVNLTATGSSVFNYELNVID